MEESTVLEMVGEINEKARGSPRVSLEDERVEEREEVPRRNSWTAEHRAGETENLVGLLAGIQFATVILIAQRRIPEAGPIEFFVVLSMLMISASHSKIVAFLPDSTTIQNDLDALKFLLFGVPIFLFLIVIELWFIAYLFSYDPNEELKAFKENAEKVLIIGKALSISKLSLIVTLIAMPRFVARLTRHKKR